MDSSEKESREPDGAGSAADQESQIKENYPKIGRDARSRGAPWFKLWSSEWLAKTRRVGMTDVGILITWLAAMHEAGRPLEDDEKRLGRLCGCRTSTIRKARETLLADGLIVSTGLGLWSPIMQQQIESEHIKSKLAQQNVSQRWKKDKQNQRQDDTGVSQEEEDIDASGGGQSPPPTAGEQSSDSESYDQAPRDELDAHPRAVKGEEIYNDDVGWCRIGDVLDYNVVVIAADGRRGYLNDEGGEIPLRLAPFQSVDDVPF
jgi:hypothetical protein